MQVMSKEGNPIMVAVFMITYNHENYIEGAIQSVLDQVTDFEYKLFIGDDKSTDRTSVIIQNIQEKYPDQIDYTLNESNLGIPKNSLNIYNKCLNSGAKYVALLEGDDYWTDPFKLQKQVDFLEENKDYAISFHSLTALKEDGQTYQLPDFRETRSFEFLDLTQRNFIPTASCIFRLYDDSHLLFQKLINMSVGDWALHMLNAQHGKIHYMTDTMAVYRLHATGDWSSMSTDQMLTKSLKCADELNKLFEYRYHAEFEKGKINLTNIYKAESTKYGNTVNGFGRVLTYIYKRIVSPGLLF
jgi:glycosyltransferase involved in cell wall biosynthesis